MPGTLAPSYPHSYLLKNEPEETVQVLGWNIEEGHGGLEV
jgi:hypothetical protein